MISTVSKFVSPKYVRLGYEGNRRCQAPKHNICYSTVRCLVDNNPIEQAIRLACPDYMTNGTEDQVEIKYYVGFELFNRIAYHNYENWAGGFSVEGKGFKCSAEYLDTAVYSWAEAVINATGDQRRIDTFNKFMEAPVGVKW